MAIIDSSQVRLQQDWISEWKWWIAAGAVVSLVTLRLVYLAFFHPLAGYPGPKLWAVSRIPWAYHVMRGDVWHLQQEFHDCYGPVVRIAPDELTYINPGTWKEIYTAKPQLLKDPCSQTPPLNGADSLFTAAGNDHRRIRGAFINAFSDKALREQSSIIEGYASQFIARLRSELIKDAFGIVNIQQIFSYATFDIISDLTWGEAPKALQTSGEHDWGRRFFLHAQFSTVRNCLSRFWPLSQLLHAFFLRVTSKQRMDNTKLTTERIERRIAAGDSRSDFMTPVVGKISESGTKGITKSEVLTNGLAVVIANSQLSTIALTTAVYLCSREPHHMQRLTDEINAVGFENEEDIKVSSTQSLSYLNAVINETLRLHHPTPGNLPRIVPKGGMMIDGAFVPGNTVVGVSLHNIHTRHENFLLPLEFHPERFLDSASPLFDKRFANDRLDAFAPFSMGPRNCIGGKVFLAEARVLLARLVWSFDVKLMEPESATWLKQKGWLVYEPKALRVQLNQR